MASILFACVFFVTLPFTWYHKFYLVTLTLKFDLLFKNINLGHSFLTGWGRTFAFHTLIFLWQNFRPYHNFWLGDLDAWPTLKNLCHSFLTGRGRTIMFLVCIPDDKTFSCWIISNLTHLKKSLTLAIIFGNRRGRVFIFHMWIPYEKTLHTFYLVTLTFKFYLLFKSFGVGYNLWIKEYLLLLITCHRLVVVFLTTLGMLLVMSKAIPRDHFVWCLSVSASICLVVFFFWF